MTGKRCALISVYNKAGIEEFARALIGLRFDIIASGGTAKALSAVGIPVTDVAAFVGGGAILGHRVVTLSRELHAALLATDSKEDVHELAALGIPKIDLVCVDMYPLGDEILDPKATTQSVIEKTDVGGPAMLRSAAKGGRIVICTPDDRQAVLAWLHAGEPDGEQFRRRLMAKAEATVAHYCLLSAGYHGGYMGLLGEPLRNLRYGENPLQEATLCGEMGASPDWLAIDRFEQVDGEPPSFVNVTDIDRLLITATQVAAVVMWNALYQRQVPAMALAAKHGNLCGFGMAAHPIDAVKRMIDSDRTSIFGGSILLTFEVDAVVAEILRSHGEGNNRPFDVIIAPNFTPEGLARLSRKKHRAKMFSNPALGRLGPASRNTSALVRQVRGGFIVQEPNDFLLEIPSAWKNLLLPHEIRDLVVAWAISSTSDSNTIVLVEDGILLGRGIAQPSRVDACKVAISQARAHGHEHRLRQAVAASDSFFPALDGIETLDRGGVKTIFATSGSICDDEVRARCEMLGIRLFMLPDKEARGFFGH